MNYYNTLDIDNGDKYNLSLIIAKITKNKCCKNLEWKESATKGYHIKMICSKKCDVCRLVFDDMKRLEHDENREEKFRNVLFTEKEWIHPNDNFNKKHICEGKCKKEQLTSFMIYKELTPEQTKQKLKEGKIKLPFTPFGKKYTFGALCIGYDYFECSICGWFKFVKGNNK